MKLVFAIHLNPEGSVRQRLKIHALLVLTMGVIAIMRPPRLAAAPASRECIEGSYCWSDCVDAVWYMNCEGCGTGQYTECHWDWNCDGGWGGFVAYCAYES